MRSVLSVPLSSKQSVHVAEDATQRLRIFAVLWFSAALWLLLAGASWAGPAVPDRRAGDEALLSAFEAASKGDRERLSALVRQNDKLWRSHPLAMYPEFWLLRLRLRSFEAPARIDADVAAFIERNPQTFVADRLRLEWTQALGARAAGAGDWNAFERERVAVVWADDAQLRCWALLSRYQGADAAGKDALVREVRTALAAHRESGSDGCMRLTEVLIDDGRISAWERVRVLVEYNQLTTARRLAARAPAPVAAQAQAALDRPAAWLTALATRLEKVINAPLQEREIALVALARLSADNPDLALRHAHALNLHFSPEERALAWGRVGHMLAIKHAPEAREAYLRGGVWVGVVPGTARADEVLEWRVRAALRHTQGPDWAMVRTSIERMPADLQADPSWVYWQARALLAVGETAETVAAHDLLRSIANGVHYYGLLAAEALGDDVRLPAAVTPTLEAVAQFETNAGIERALRFYDLGLRVEGNREWNWQVRTARSGQGMDDQELLALAQFAHQRGLLDRVIATSERTRGQFNFDQRYPTPHREQLFTHVVAAQLDAPWVYGLIRQESRFMVDVRSSVGAAGLMQLMPNTARYVARRAGLVDFSHTRITDADLNLRLGTNYLRYVFDDLDGSALLATAAYNAGPSRSRAWRASLARPVEGAIFAETIPFNETRDYVKRVLANAVIYYAVLGDGRVPSLRARLGQIEPKRAEVSELP